MASKTYAESSKIKADMQRELLTVLREERDYLKTTISDFEDKLSGGENLLDKFAAVKKI